MIEHPNSLLVQHYLQAVHKGDRETLRSLWGPTIIWHVQGHSPWQGDIQGADQILDFLAEIGSFGGDGLNTKIEDVMISNTHAAMLCHTEAKPGERVLTADFMVILKIFGRRIHEITSIAIDSNRAANFWVEATIEGNSPRPPLVAA